VVGKDIPQQPGAGGQAPDAVRGEGDGSKATWFELMHPYLQPHGPAPPQGHPPPSLTSALVQVLLLLVQQL